MTYTGIILPGASYVKLETGEASWVQDAAVKAASVGSEAVLNQLGQSAEGAIKDARSLVISDLGISTPDARAAVAGAWGKGFASLLASGKVLIRGIGSAGLTIFAQMGPDLFDSSRVLRAIAETNSLNTEEIDQHMLCGVKNYCLKYTSRGIRQRCSECSAHVFINAASNFRTTL